MIKTISFAPPRPRSTSVASSTNKAKKAASTPEPVSPQETAKKAVASELAAKGEVSAATARDILAAAATKTVVKRNKRVKVPENLAEQYGEKLSKRVQAGIEAPVEDTPKKRLNRAERQARRELMNPDEDFLSRLQRVQSVGAKPAKAPKRGRGWRFDCGRCGQTSYFETSGAICTCGALAIRE